MITIYHNPRCSKSRNCNLMLEKLNEKVQVVNYMTTPFNYKTLLKKVALYTPSYFTGGTNSFLKTPINNI